MRRATMLMASLLIACGEAQPTETPGDELGDEPIAGEAVSETARLGPVSATVSLTPASPRLGDTMRLELRVEAEPGVAPEMPSFGEALGRFSIVDFTPRDERGQDGRRVATQTYRLQAAASGHLRVPPLRITFEDRRANREEARDETREEARDRGGDPDDAPRDRELLTPELSVQVASVLPEDEAGVLRPPQAELDPHVGLSWLARRGWIFGLLGLGVLALAALGVRAHRRRPVGPIESPYDQARRRLSELEAKGEPDPETPDRATIDGWYVELSAIVRRYLEDRFALRAPELTTEEFLRVAQRSDHLRAEHKQLLAEFLAGCDRVKFAGYRPDAVESRQALASARRFLDDTRPDAEPRQEAGA